MVKGTLVVKPKTAVLKYDTEVFGTMVSMHALTDSHFNISHYIDAVSTEPHLFIIIL